MFAVVVNGVASVGPVANARKRRFSFGRSRRVAEARPQRAERDAGVDEAAAAVTGVD